MKTFTEDEKTIAKNISKEYKWMARDRDGELCIYEEKPRKEENYWYFDGYGRVSYFNHLFSAIKWEDKEPTLISDIYNPQVLDDAEREYLKTVLKPFRGAVKYVEKVSASVFDEDNRKEEYVFVAFDGGLFAFPNFDAGTMYSGMELNKEYKLDELGITYEEDNHDDQ